MIEADRHEVPAEQVLAARRGYYAAVSFVDDRIRSVLDALELTGLADDTVVILASDHGELLGEHGLWYKMSWLDGSSRVPLVVHAPGRFRAGRVSEAVSLLDLLPTVLELAGGFPDGAPAAPLDGRSLVPALAGGRLPAEPVLGEYLAEGTTQPSVLVAEGPWKLVRCPGDPDLLTDVGSDPGELVNRAGDQDGTAATFERLSEIAGGRWNLATLRTEVLAAQSARRLVAAALARGTVTPWDHRTPDDAAGRYIATGRDFWQTLERARLE
jgi:choline-sulfatase